MMHPNAALITRFYDAFAALDAETMAACYHADAHFSDPVFPDLKGPQIGDMWRMLAKNARDLEVTFRDVQADGGSGSAHWDARYTFSRAKRPVHNVIHARFEFRDGLIVRHRDTFDLWRWSRQALGMTGVLGGWSPLVQRKVRAEAAGRLAAFQERK